MAAEHEYTSEHVQIKEGIEHVRIRPSMYIGSTNSEGLHHLVYEVVDNSIDEALIGHCSLVNIIIYPDNVIEVQDNGRGIPVDIHKEVNVSTLEVVMTTLGAGGKFDSDAYSVSGGLHGVGVSVVNALSEYCKVYVFRNNKTYFQAYERGIPIEDVKEISDAAKRGTTIIFKPDDSIFETTSFSFDTLSNRLRELAFLNKGISINIEDRRLDDDIKKHSFLFEGGIVAFVQYLNGILTPIHDKPIYFQRQKDNFHIEIAMEYNESFQSNIFTYVNNINTKEGGTHLAGFRSALTKTINDGIKKLGLDKKLKGNLEGDDVREGLTAVISVKLKNPQFEGQTKTKLGNSEVRGITESVTTEGLKEFFEDNPNISKKIFAKCISAYNARKAAQAKRDSVRKSFLERDSLPGKLADCSDKNPDVCELYIVEGDSAGGSAKQGRNRAFQAILPLWGKMLNVEKTRIEKVLDNDKLQPIIATLGTGIDQHFDYSKLRYNKIIIMADADVDGSHIRTLLLTFFYRYLTPLVENGNIYIAMPPLYKISIGPKKVFYSYSDKERDSILKEHAGPNSTQKVYIQRYKGLGEMNPDQLWETTMDPEKRSLMKITLDDAVEANEIFSILMGEKVEPRRLFIEGNAVKVKNLDV